MYMPTAWSYANFELHPEGSCTAKMQDRGSVLSLSGWTIEMNHLLIHSLSMEFGTVMLVCGRFFMVRRLCSEVGLQSGITLQVWDDDQVILMPLKPWSIDVQMVEFSYPRAA
jgi:hypothetical protein